MDYATTTTTLPGVDFPDYSLIAVINIFLLLSFFLLLLAMSSMTCVRTFSSTFEKCRSLFQSVEYRFLNVSHIFKRP